MLVENADIKIQKVDILIIYYIENIHFAIIDRLWAAYSIFFNNSSAGTSNKFANANKFAVLGSDVLFSHFETA